MTGLTYRGKPARVDPHLPPDYPPVGFRWRRGVELTPRLARCDAEADYFVVSAVFARALGLKARLHRLFGPASGGEAHR